MPARLARAVTAVVLAASTVAIGPAGAAPAPAAPVDLRQAAPAPDPVLLAAIRQRLPVATPVAAATSTAPSSVTPSASRSGSAPDPGSVPAAGPAAPGMPAAALAAYQRAQATLARTRPGCHLPWTLLAGIGTVESDNGQYGGAVLGADGVDSPAIIGIALNGSVPGTAVVRDTDRGRWDGDPVYDHAVGPMQFLPGTWAAVGVSAVPGRPPNPQNIDDAALSAGRYLCESGGDLATRAGQSAAVLTYNDSATYVDAVLALSDAYAAGLLGPVLPSRRLATTSAPATTLPATSAPATSAPAAITPTAVPTSPPIAAATTSPDGAAATTTTTPDSALTSPTASPSPSPTPTPTSPSPTATSPSPTATSPSPTATSPSPTPTSPSPTPTSPSPTPTSPSPTATPSPSPTASPSAPGGAPGPVSVVTIGPGPGPGTVSVTWDPPAVGAAPAEYLVEWQRFGNGTWSTVGSVHLAASATGADWSPSRAGTYRASIVTAGVGGRSDPVSSAPYPMRVR